MNSYKLSHLFPSVLNDARIILDRAGVSPYDLDNGNMWNVLHKINADRTCDDSHATYRNNPERRFLPYDGRERGWYYGGVHAHDEHVTTLLKKVRQALIDEISTEVANLPATV